jgi:hypothetical protein
MKKLKLMFWPILLGLHVIYLFGYNLVVYLLTLEAGVAQSV